MRDTIRDAINSFRRTSERADATTKSALGRFIDRRRDYIDPALDEVALALREFAEARVVATQRCSTLEIGPVDGGAGRAFIRFALEDGGPGAGEVIRIRGEWAGRGERVQYDETHAIDEVDRDRVDDVLERAVPAILASLSRVAN
jgi:hypothetical protein